MVRNADADCYRADVHVAIIDVPAVLAFEIAAAGEGGHALLKRGQGRQANRSIGRLEWRSGEKRSGAGNEARQVCGLHRLLAAAYCGLGVSERFPLKAGRRDAVHYCQCWLDFCDSCGERVKHRGRNECRSPISANSACTPPKKRPQRGHELRPSEGVLCALGNHKDTSDTPVIIPNPRKSFPEQWPILELRVAYFGQYRNARDHAVPVGAS